MASRVPARTKTASKASDGSGKLCASAVGALPFALFPYRIQSELPEGLSSSILCVDGGWESDGGELAEKFRVARRSPCRGRERKLQIGTCIHTASRVRRECGTRPTKSGIGRTRRELDFENVTRVKTRLEDVDREFNRGGSRGHDGLTRHEANFCGGERPPEPRRLKERRGNRGPTDSGVPSFQPQSVERKGGAIRS